MFRPRVFLADDHEEFLEAEAALLRPHFDVIGMVHDGASLVAAVQRLKPDVVVVDITMPEMGGIDAVHRLVQCGSHARFVFLTAHAEEEFVQACLAEGAQGYVWKGRMKAHLVPAVHAALEGSAYVSPLTSA
jgi:DNA-binding NarL/FixJ family response regulator